MIAAAALCLIWTLQSSLPGTTHPRTFVVTHETGKEVLSFAAPEGWQVWTHAEGWLLSPPPSGQGYFATIALQRRAHSANSLDEAVAEALEPLSGLPRFRWFHRGVQTVGTAVGMSYTVQFEAHEVLRLRRAVLLWSPESLIDISYQAPATLFPQQAGLFEDVLHSVHTPPASWASDRLPAAELPLESDVPFDPNAAAGSDALPSQDPQPAAEPPVRAPGG